jgi:hypothetical protein
VGLLTDATSHSDGNPTVVRLVGPVVRGSTVELVSVVHPKRTFMPRVAVMEPPAHRAG